MAGRGAGHLEGTHHYLPPLQCQGNNTEQCIMTAFILSTVPYFLKMPKCECRLRGSFSDFCTGWRIHISSGSVVDQNPVKWRTFWADRVNR